MQDYFDLAKKNGIQLLDAGSCQFCGANTKRGVHECIEIFNIGFDVIDFSIKENHKYRFFIVDAHTLQHSEIHGRWNNHFHLSRLHLIFKYNVKWSYQLSPKLSAVLNKYKQTNKNEYLIAPEILNRGRYTTTDILEKSTDIQECKKIIEAWSLDVYEKWEAYHNIVDVIAKEFLNENER